MAIPNPNTQMTLHVMGLEPTELRLQTPRLTVHLCRTWDFHEQPMYYPVSISLLERYSIFIYPAYRIGTAVTYNLPHYGGDTYLEYPNIVTKLESDLQKLYCKFITRLGENGEMSVPNTGS